MHQEKKIMSNKKNTILFMGYSGYFSQAIILSLINTLEIQIKDIEESQTVARRLYIVFIELAQNVMKYSKSDYAHNHDSEQILIEHDEKNYYVTTTNNINNKTLLKIENIFKNICELNKEEITKKYNELRKSGETSHENGGGIGLYQLARKSDNISYKIEKLDDNLSRLEVIVQINKYGEKTMKYKTIFIEKTLHTPEINFDFRSGIFSIEGKSYSENTFEFYKELLSSLETFFKDQTNKRLKNIIFNFKLTYFNSSSSKALFEMFDLIDMFVQSQSDIAVDINWVYDEDDDSSKEDGEDFQDSFDSLNIQLIANKTDSIS